MTGSGVDIDDVSMSGEPERQQAEVMTWRLIAAIAARTRVERIVEMHAGGGQYDTVQVHLGAQPGEGRGPSYLDCNRPGRLHVLSECQSVPPKDVFGDLVHGAPLDDAVRWVLDAATPLQDPDDGRVAAAVDLMAEAVATGVGLTNLDPTVADAAEVLVRYKGQEVVERRFGGFKGPLAVAPIFLKNNRRIEALLSVICLALLIFCLVERQVRHAIAPEVTMTGFPGRPKARPTGRLIFEALGGLPLVPASATGPPVIPAPQGMAARILDLLDVDPITTR